MATIQVDFEVFKELTARRSSEMETENDVIRKLLGLHSVSLESVSLMPGKGRDLPWVCRGISFPQGTKFRATFRGDLYLGKVDHGSLVVNNERYTSFSAAAVSITGTTVDGWKFWECQLPGTYRWKMVSKLMKRDIAQQDVYSINKNG